MAEDPPLPIGKSALFSLLSHAFMMTVSAFGSSMARVYTVAVLVCSN